MSGVIPFRSTALDRARVAWQGHAAMIRGELRGRGVRGKLRRLDERAAGERGSSLAQQMFRDFYDAALCGLPIDVTLGRVTQVMSLTARLAYDEAEAQAPNRSA